MRYTILLLILMILPVNLHSQETLLKTGFYRVVEHDSCKGTDGYTMINNSGTEYCISNNPIITDANFKSVNIKADTTESGITYSVGIKLDTTGTRIIKEVTGKMIGQKAAFLINNEIIAAPTVRDQISTGHIAVFCDQETIEKVKAALKTY